MSSTSLLSGTATNSFLPPTFDLRAANRSQARRSCLSRSFSLLKDLKYQCVAYRMELVVSYKCIEFIDLLAL